MSKITSVSSISDVKEGEENISENKTSLDINLTQKQLFKIFIEQNFDLDMIISDIENEIRNQIIAIGNKRKKIVIEEYAYNTIFTVLNVKNDIPLTTILAVLKDTYVRLQYESVLIFNYLFNAQMKERVIINLILNRLRLTHRDIHEIKPTLHSFVAFYLDALKESIERAKIRNDLRWATSFFAIRIFGMYNISLIDLEDALSYLEGVPVVLDKQKVIGIADSKHLLTLLSKFKQERGIEYSQVFRTQLALREGYIIKKKAHIGFKFASNYVAPVLNIADVFYWPSKLAPLIAVVGTLMVIIAPTKE